MLTLAVVMLLNTLLSSTVYHCIFYTTLTLGLFQYDINHNTLKVLEGTILHFSMQEEVAYAYTTDQLVNHCGTQGISLIILLTKLMPSVMWLH
jgi:hypothetical protein